ncbi:hypothetical protein RF55_18526 [Lasius niger]|uniref:Uncharacterized protein n=1 Tax=Lasius niger TaxID=67767 RepID=A0A0J7K162_LASNI|nr:hypothetical protein RF55_18526 [Lasius niger]
MSEQTDIIQAINELLGDLEYWDKVLPPHFRPEPTPPAPAPFPQPRPPKVGTLIQRSDHVIARSRRFYFSRRLHHRNDAKVQEQPSSGRPPAKRPSPRPPNDRNC